MKADPVPVVPEPVGEPPTVMHVAADVLGDVGFGSFRELLRKLERHDRLVFFLPRGHSVPLGPVLASAVERLPKPAEQDVQVLGVGGREHG